MILLQQVFKKIVSGTSVKINISKIVTEITNSLTHVNNEKVHRLQILKKGGRHFCGLMWERYTVFPGTSAALDGFFGKVHIHSNSVHNLRLFPITWFRFAMIMSWDPSPVCLTSWSGNHVGREEGQG